jgi:YidC/Oxa1 family membrane protein insertase
MRFCYDFTLNYGLALMLFAVITKVFMLPFSIKQQKNSIVNTINQRKIKPKLDQLKVKYGKNKELYNSEMMKLYQEEGINPVGNLGSGCLMPLIQLVIMFGLVGVIYRPLTYILSIPASVIDNARGILKDLHGAVNLKFPELDLIEAVKVHTEFFSGLGSELVDSIAQFKTTLFGVNFTSVPKGWSLVTLIPIMTILTQIVSTLQVSKNSVVATEIDPAQQRVTKIMQFLPIFLFSYIYFSMPVGIAFYFMFSNVMAIIQTEILTKKYNVKEAVDKFIAAEKMAKKKKHEERKSIERTVEVENLQNEAERISAKELNKQKINQARKRIEEKYDGPPDD